MSANVDQRSKGQPSQVSNGNGKDVMKEDDPYLQQAPQHSVRSWSDQASDGAYGAATMSTAGVSDSFFHNYYAPNMSYPFMSQGLGGSDAPWSNSADSMFSMGYDYSNVYGGFGFPFNNWEYPNDYWSGSQPVRKDQRGYAEDPYYPQEMIPTDSYGMMNGAAPPPEPQEPIGTVEQGLRGMSLAPSSSTIVDSRKKMVDISQPPMLPDGFGDPTLMMPPSIPSNAAPGVISGGSGGSVQGSSKKTSWAAIASQPARPQQQMRPRTIPRAPVHPNKSMDIGTWDTRGNPAKSPMSMTQTLPSQPPPPRQSWTTNSVRSRQIQPHSTSGPGNVAGPSSGSSNTSSNSLNPNTNSTANSSSSNTTSSNNSTANSSSANSNNNSNNVVAAPSSSVNMSGGGSHPSSYANYSSSAGNNMGSRNVVASSSTTNGSHGDSQVPGGMAISHPVLDQLKSSNLYNPKEFNLNPKSARFFVIKSYSEDDIHRSIKYNIWCSTEHGNKRLDQAFREREGKGPVYLIYSVNASGHFCGIAQMMSPVDYNKMPGVWAQDKWKGQFEVKWVYVKDVPNGQLRHIRLENNENKPVTNSRDTQEVPPEKGKQVLRIMHSYKHLTSIFDDFSHYEKRQEEDHQHQTHQQSMHRDNRGDHHSGYNHHRDNRGGDHERDNHHRNDHFRNDGRDGRGDHRYEHRGGFDRGDGREHRGGFDRDHRDRGEGRNNRDNRRGGRQN